MRKPGSTVRRIWREPGAPAITRLRIDRGAWWHGLSGFSLLDWLTLIFFGLAWFGYEFVVDRTSVRKRSLNVAINEERHHWMQEMALVDNRIMDSNLHASLQNGTAFFASTSLLAVGGALALLRATDDVLTILSEMPFGLATSRVAWEVKVSGLVIIFVYAFFKFAWSYRLFNYTAVLIGAVPRPGSSRGRDLQAAAERAASMNVVAAPHFNRGQRAFFFALAYLGWFVSGYVLIVSTLAVMLVMWRRQFASDALATLAERATLPQK
jgi:uncharacterized membrane protein